MLFAGLDVGTSGCKAAVLDEFGMVHGRFSREYGFEMPEKGYVELNPVTVWNHVKEILREIAQKCGAIAAISVSSIGESVIPVDAKGNVLMNGMTYLDIRGSETLEMIRRKFDQKWMHMHTGVPLNAMYTLCKLLWMKECRPEILETAEHIFMFGDFVTWKLSGSRMIDPSTASRTMLFDIKKRTWSRKIGDAFKLPLFKFSTVFETGTQAGFIRQELADEVGFSRDTEIVLGCHDQCSALLGAGATKTGDTMAGEGSTESINMIGDETCFNERFVENQLCFEPYVHRGQYVIPVGQLTHGTSIRWFVEKFGADFGTCTQREGESVYDWAARGCAKDCGEVFFLPYLSKVKSMDRNNQALGVFIGMDTSTGKAELYRALLEGLCFESKSSFELLEKTGIQPRSITASGGCSRSELFMQMKSDILQQNIKILENPDSGTIGLAMICAVALGVYADYTEAAEVFVKIRQEYIPKNSYEKKYQKYKMISNMTKELYKII